jgi:hypothetical protein
MTNLTRSPGRRPVYRALLAFALAAAPPSLFDAAAALSEIPGAQRVDGSNLARADFAGGRFEQRDGRWTEYGSDGGARFDFEETGRDEWSVYLVDRSRNVALQLDVHRRMVTLVENGEIRRDLYAITGVTASWQRGYAERTMSQPPRSERVDGSNLSRADFADGRFELSGGRWSEYGRDGRPRYQFEETGRDEWSVYLLDRSRNVAIQLDVYRHMVTVAENGGPRADLYAITDAAASPRRDPYPYPQPYSQPYPGDYSASGSFHQERGRPDVMFQYADTGHCRVENPTQMDAFGGPARVRIVPALAMGGLFTGRCAWPNGFFRRSSEGAVYRLHGPGPYGLGRLACHVTEPRQMELFGGFGRVAVVDPKSHLFLGREAAGECSDP